MQQFISFACFFLGDNFYIKFFCFSILYMNNGSKCCQQPIFFIIFYSAGFAERTRFLLQKTPKNIKQQKIDTILLLMAVKKVHRM